MSLLYSQEGTVDNSAYRKNSIYLEAAGNGALFSINYDRQLLARNDHTLIGRVGFGFLFNILFFEGNYLFGKRHCLEHGVSYGHDFYGHWDMYYRIGYRYRGKKGLLIRAAPLLHFNKFSGNPSPIDFWYGVSIGYSF